MFHSYFFDAELVGGLYDRVHLAKDFARYFAQFIGNGVFVNPSTNMQVVAHVPADMGVSIRNGACWINGYMGVNDDLYTLPIATASGSLPRIDAIVLRWSQVDRQIYPAVKTGSPSATPTIPTLERSPDIWELMLAYIEVPAGATNIQDFIINDTRSQSQYCGWVHALFDQLESTDLFIQFSSAYNEWFQRIQNLFEGDVSQFENDFMEWFESLKDVLSDDVAGNIVLELQKLQARTPSAQIGTITHNMGRYPICTIHNADNGAGLTGAGVTGAGGGNLFTTPADFEIGGFDSVTVTAVAQFANHTEIHRINATQYSFVQPGNATSLLLTLR